MRTSLSSAEPAVGGRSRAALAVLVLLLASQVACEIPPGPPAPTSSTGWPAHTPPAGQWRVRAEPGLAFERIRVRCDASARDREGLSGEQSVDVAPGCTVDAVVSGGEVRLRLPGGLPGEVWCDASGGCRRIP